MHTHTHTHCLGGICENIQTFSGDGVTQSLTLNTGIVTILNYNARIPSPISALTFAHQAGHNFGSTVRYVAYVQCNMHVCVCL